MSKVKNELEELSFRYLEPQAYEALRAKVDAKRRATEGLIEQLKTTHRGEARARRQVPVVEIDGRIKRLWSIHQKLKRQQIELEQVYDFIALRIITDSVKDCYAALGIIHQTWSPVPGPHQGLHRDAAAQRLPVAAHLGHQRARHAVRGADPHDRDAPDGGGRHRRALEVQGRPRRRSAATSATSSGCGSCSSIQQEVRDPQEFIQNLKVELYPEEVYTFTPKGQVKAFPRGATPIDFAYAIHTDVGHQCVGARVNGKMVPLRARLKNGDIVEIVTQAGHKPSRDWLNFVVTSHARYKIKHLIRLEERRARDRPRAQGVREGARRYDLQPRRRCTRARRSRRRWPTSARKKADDLFALIGYGTLSAKQLLGQARARRPAAREAAGRRWSRPPSSARSARGEEKIKVRGFDDLLVFRARCCNPIRGEKIVGYITRGKGVSVHSATCPNVVNLLYDPERRIDVEWDKARRRRRRQLHRQADDGGRGSEGAAGRRQREDRRHQHQHQEHGSAHRRRSARAHRRDGRDQRPEAPREGDQVAARRGRRARRRTREPERLAVDAGRSAGRQLRRRRRWRRSRCARRAAAARPGRSSAPGTARRRSVA